jgi:hypothetical protein
VPEQWPEPDPAALANVDRLLNAVRDALDRAKRSAACALDAVAACEDRVGELQDDQGNDGAAVDAVTTTLRDAHGAVDTLYWAVCALHSQHYDADQEWRMLSRKHDLVGGENFERGRRLLGLRNGVASFAGPSDGEVGSRMHAWARELGTCLITWRDRTAGGAQRPDAPALQHAARSLGDQLGAVRRGLENLRRRVGPPPAATPGEAMRRTGTRSPASRPWRWDRGRGGTGRSRPGSGR